MDCEINQVRHSPMTSPVAHHSRLPTITFSDNFSGCPFSDELQDRTLIPTSQLIILRWTNITITLAFRGCPFSDRWSYPSYYIHSMTIILRLVTRLTKFAIPRWDSGWPFLPIPRITFTDDFRIAHSFRSPGCSFTGMLYHSISWKWTSQDHLPCDVPLSNQTIH